MKTVCVTGHRPAKLPWKYTASGRAYEDYRNSLSKLIEEHIRDGYTHFISGMALGVDLDFAELVLYYRDEKKNDITLECALPCPSQTSKWQKTQVVRYNAIVERANEVTVVNNRYFKACMLLRNEYMVNKSDSVIAVWDGVEEGGTWYTVNYARKNGKDVHFIEV